MKMNSSFQLSAAPGAFAAPVVVVGSTLPIFWIWLTLFGLDLSIWSSWILSSELRFICKVFQRVNFGISFVGIFFGTFFSILLGFALGQTFQVSDNRSWSRKTSWYWRGRKSVARLTLYHSEASPKFSSIELGHLSFPILSSGVPVGFALLLFVLLVACTWASS